jgi:hypothetical protein
MMMITFQDHPVITEEIHLAIPISPRRPVSKDAHPTAEAKALRGKEFNKFPILFLY